MSLRASGVLVATLLATSVGCSNESGEEVVSDPRAFTVSYRNQVRLPASAQALSAQDFANQLRSRDPVGPIRCGADESQPFKDVTSFLGGIAWTHPVAIIKDQSQPLLYTGKLPEARDPATFAPTLGAAADAAAPTISRPDLVGVHDGVAIFLSKQHGLLTVDTRSGTPSLSCSMKLPGEPMSFLVHGNELVVIVNARNGFNRSAILRYAVNAGQLAFVDAIPLEGQTIVDARLFDATIVLYTAWTRPLPPPAPPADVVPPPQSTSSGGGSGAAAASDMASPANRPQGERLGTKVLVVQWDDHLAVDWEDALLDDPAAQDPFEGVELKPYVAGDVIAERKTYKPFISASERYVVVPRDVQTTRFTHYETVSYQVCATYNPHFEQVQQCHVNYERRPNPDYKAPNPSTGDYACNGKKLADCIQEAAPSVSQYVNVPVGQTCDMVWQGRCEKYETRTETYPRFTQEDQTELTIYRFEGGTFTKLDSSFAKLVPDPAKPDALVFETSPLSVKGLIANKNQVQFQNGHLYVFSDRALQTLAVAGSSIAYLDRLEVTTNTEQNPAVVFSNDRAMISSPTSGQSSTVAMLDLSTPSKPASLNAFTMPGNTTQLILTNGGILGPGQVSLTNGNVYRSLQKLTLFSKEGGAELDNLLLGTEYDTFESSWFDSSDDQRIRADGQRLFLPYTGRHHADAFEPAAHRLNITRVENDRLISERSFEVSDSVVRTAPVDDNHSLVFSDSATYLVDRTSGDWALSTLRETFVPFATYRLDDNDLFAQIARVGSKCRVTTHAGDGQIFADGGALATFDFACNEVDFPIGWGSKLLFGATRVGVEISADGRAIVPLAAAEIDSMLSPLARRNRYCYVADGPAPAKAQIVDYLDVVPTKIVCRSR